MRSLFLLSFMFFAVSGFAQDKPNVLFVFADQMRNHAMGVNHEDPVITPNLDNFAGEAVLFNNAISTSPVCTPFRGQLITGRFPLNNKMTRNCTDKTSDMYLRPDSAAFGNAFKRNGYQTGYIGKWHLDDAKDAIDILGYSPDGTRRWDTYTPPGPKRQGFDFWHAYNAYDSHEAPHYWENSTEMIEPGVWSPIHETDVAINFIENRDKSKPFMLMVSINPPHPPYQSPREYIDLYDENDIMLNRKNVILEGDGANAADNAIEYFSNTTGVDVQFGRIVDYLKQEGLFDNTIVVFTADHGEMMGSHGRMGKSKWYEEAINTPLIVSYPAKMQRGVSDCIVSPVDYLPTLLSLAGIETKDEYDGKDLSASFKDVSLIEQDTVFLAGYQGDFWSSPDSSWLKGGWRGVRTLDNTFVIKRYLGEQEVHLYDMQMDKFQMSPLIAEKSEDEEEFSVYYNSLKAYLERTGDPYLESGDAAEQPYSLLVNPGFEEGTLTGWNNWNNDITNNKDNVYMGDWAGRLPAGKEGSLQQSIELKSNTSYRFSLWARVSLEGEFVKMIVKDYGGTKKIVTVSATDYMQYTIDFTTGILTGPVSISLYKGNSGYGDIYADNFELYETGDLVTEIKLSVAASCNYVPLGGTISVNASVLPLTALDKSFTWSVQNGSGEAEVDNEGVVTGIAAGTVEVVATANDGSNISASYPVEVVDGSLDLQAISLSSDLGENNLLLGHSTVLTAEFDPVFYCNKELLWSVENISGRGDITQDGILIARAEGEVKAIATSMEDPSVSGELIINLVLGERHTYFIDDIQGNDDNDGLSAQSAWKSLAKVNASVFNPGDSILFKTGGVWEGQLEIESRGAESYPVVFTKYGNGNKPLINGNGGKDYTLRLLNSDYTEVSDFEITNTGPSVGGGRYGVVVEADNMGSVFNSVLRNLDVHDVNGDPIKANGGGGGIVWKNGGETPSRLVDALIEGCHIYDCERNGIVGKSSYTGAAYQKKKEYYNLRLKIRQNLIERIPGDGIVVLGCDSALAEYNICRDFTDDLPNVPKNAAAGIWPWNSLNTLIQHNEVSGHMAGWDGQGFDSDWNCDGTIIQYNYSHDNAGGFILICSNGEYGYNDNTIVRYNISVNDGFRTWGTGADFCPSIHVAGNVYNVKIYNNSIFSFAKPASVEKSFMEFTKWSAWSNVVYVENNIFQALDAMNFIIGSSENTRFKNNLYSSNTILPADNMAITGDPLFVKPGNSDDVDNYRLQKGSPAIGSGIVIYDNGEEDFFGNLLPVDLPPNIGADNSNLVSVFPKETGLSNREMPFIVYPNPVTYNIMNIKLQEELSGAGLTLLSLTGSLLFSREIERGCSDDILGLDMAPYRPGMYLLVLNDGEDNYSLKIIKR